MNPAGNIDVLELPHGPGALDADGDGGAGQAPATRQRSSTRWWFTFDGWRTAEVDAEFVLA